MSRPSELGPRLVRETNVATRSHISVHFRRASIPGSESQPHFLAVVRVDPSPPKETRRAQHSSLLDLGVRGVGLGDRSLCDCGDLETHLLSGHALGISGNGRGLGMALLPWIHRVACGVHFHWLQRLARIVVRMESRSDGMRDCGVKSNHLVLPSTQFRDCEQLVLLLLDLGLGWYQ